MSPIKLPGYKLTADGKVAKDEKAAEAKLDLCTRLRRKHSTKIKVSRNPAPKGG